jgi:hypothetical protein
MKSQDTLYYSRIPKKFHLVFESDVSRGALRLYFYLANYQRTSDWWLYKPISDGQIKKDLKISESLLSRYRGELVKKGLILRDRKGKSLNQYKFLNHLGERT